MKPQVILPSEKDLELEEVKPGLWIVKKPVSEWTPAYNFFEVPNVFKRDRKCTH